MLLFLKANLTVNRLNKIEVSWIFLSSLKKRGWLRYSLNVLLITTFLTYFPFKILITSLR